MITMNSTVTKNSFWKYNYFSLIKISYVHFLYNFQKNQSEIERIIAKLYFNHNESHVNKCTKYSLFFLKTINPTLNNIKENIMFTYYFEF